MPETADAWRLPTRTLFPLLAALIVLPALVGFVGSSLRTDLYQGQADVFHRIENPAFGVTDRLLVSQELRAEARLLAEQVGAANGLSAQAIVDRLDVDMVQTGVREDSTVLRIIILDEDRDAALKITQDYLDAYLDSVSLEHDIPGLADSQSVLDRLEQERVAIRERLAAAVSVGDQPAQQQAEADYDRVLADLEIQVLIWNQLRPETPVIVATASGNAFVSDSPVEPRPARTAALGLIAGLILAGAALVVLRRPGTPLFD